MPTVERGKFGVYWVLDHTIKLALGLIGPPICLATLTDVNNKWIAKEQDTQEAAQYVRELELYIGSFTQPPIDQATAEPISKPDPA